MTTKKTETPQQCPAGGKHDWQYNTTTHQHECSKCGTPAPENWNEVGF